MQRILVTILTVLYMASAMGATVHIHYCMDRFMGASLLDSEGDSCGKCGMKKEAGKKSCCKDEHKTFKAAAHQPAKACCEPSAKQPALSPLFVYNTYAIDKHKACSRELDPAHAPPPYWRTCPIYILVQNFRI